MQKFRVSSYVDGYNLYHGIKSFGVDSVQNVNLWSLSDSLTRDSQELTAVHYFSAIAEWRSDHTKHVTYISALRKNNITVHLGHFRTKKRRCDNCGNVRTEHEEKETDVKIALQILEDAMDDKFDTAFIMSADADLVPVIQSIRKRFPEKRFVMVLPKVRFKRAHDMKSAVHAAIPLTVGRLRKHQLTTS